MNNRAVKRWNTPFWSGCLSWGISSAFIVLIVESLISIIVGIYFVKEDKKEKVPLVLSGTLIFMGFIYIYFASMVLSHKGYKRLWVSRCFFILSSFSILWEALIAICCFSLDSGKAKYAWINTLIKQYYRHSNKTRNGILKLGGGILVTFIITQIALLFLLYIYSSKRSTYEEIPNDAVDEDESPRNIFDKLPKLSPSTSFSSYQTKTSTLPKSASVRPQHEDPLGFGLGLGSQHRGSQLRGSPFHSNIINTVINNKHFQDRECPDHKVDNDTESLRVKKESATIGKKKLKKILYYDEEEKRTSEKVLERALEINSGRYNNKEAEASPNFEFGRAKKRIVGYIAHSDISNMKHSNLI